LCRERNMSTAPALPFELYDRICSLATATPWAFERSLKPITDVVIDPNSQKDRLIELKSTLSVVSEFAMLEVLFESWVEVQNLVQPQSTSWAMPDASK
jgi:hypothetical protein